jgi:hypothetical protein
MATRYCGALRISVTWSDAAGEYKATVHTSDGRWQGGVRAPAVLQAAVDSPEAYDGAAHAAVTFAVEESHCAHLVEDAAVNVDGSGWLIERPAAYRARVAAQGDR